MNESINAEPTRATNDELPARSSGAWWRLPLMLTAVLVAIVAARASRLEERSAVTRSPAAPPAEATGKSVSLIIQYGGGRERKFDTIPWHEGMTVDDLMTAATRLPDGIKIGVYGDHEMTMLSRIDDASNQWAGGSNWTYQVNDVAADRSIAVFELRPDDRVLWTFGPQQ